MALTSADCEFIRCLIREALAGNHDDIPIPGSAISSPSLSMSASQAVPTLQQVTTAGATTNVLSSFTGGLHGSGDFLFTASGAGNIIFQGSAAATFLSSVIVNGGNLTVTGGGQINTPSLHFSAAPGIYWDASASYAAATAGGAALPAAPQGFILTNLSGYGNIKIPYYNT